MDLSIWPTVQQPWEDLVEVTLHADRTGWYGVYVWDHFMGDGGEFGADVVPTLESTATLAALGALTERLRVAPLVLGNTYRHPAVVANWAITLDHITNGRAVLGLGAGWQRNEHEQYGIGLPSPGERVARLDEACRVVRGLLHQELTDIDGDHYVVRGARSEPKPVQPHLPLLIGGKGDRMLGLVARHADVWNMWGLPEVIAGRAEVLDAACERIDRDPATIRRTAQALVCITDDPARARSVVESTAPRAAFAGTAGQFAELVAQWADVGVEEVIVPDGLLGDGQARLEALDAIRSAVAAVS